MSDASAAAAAAGPAAAGPASSTEPASFRVPVRQLLGMAGPAIVVGIVSALTLWGLDELAHLLEHWIWEDLSESLGRSADDPLMIFGVLTATGLAIGLVVRYAPGHAGPDPATHGLVSKPLPPMALPGLALAMVLMLAGGVSLGPEAPIMGINAGLAVWLGLLLIPRIPAQSWLALATAGTIGAMFGTPVAAALMFSELDPGDRRIPLWDRLFAPLLSATSASLVMLQLADLDWSLGLPAYDSARFVDLLWAIVLAVAGAAIGVLAAVIFTPLHRLFKKLRHPVLTITVGGVVLGALGALGGEITLFKGLNQMMELGDQVATTTALGFFAIAGIKLLAMLVAASSGFRGGRIFPIVFVGAALGYGVHQAWDFIPLPVAVAGVMTGIVVAATRSGWLSVFLVLAVVPDVDLLPAVIMATLAAWLVVTNRPELIAKEDHDEHASEPGGPADPHATGGEAPPNPQPAKA